MGIKVTARHMHATPDMQEYAKQKAEAITEEFPRVEHIHIILDVEKHRNIAEFVVQAKNHIKVEAKETSDNMCVSLDGAAVKVEKQLRRLRDKAQDHRVKKNQI